MMVFSPRTRLAESKYYPISVVSLAGLVISFGGAAMWFVLPLLAEGLFKNLAVVGLLVAIPSTIVMFFDIPLGSLSDHVGRKKPLVAGLLAMVVLGLLLPSVSTLPKFIVFMILFGFANLSVVTPPRAYVMDVSPKEKTSEFFGIFDSLSNRVRSWPGGCGISSCGQLELGCFQHWSLLLTHVFGRGLDFFACGGDCREGEVDFREREGYDSEGQALCEESLDFKDLHFAGVAVLLATFIIVFVDGVVWTLEPLYVTLGLDAGVVGLILAMFVLPFILFEIPAGFLADRYGKYRMLAPGLLVTGISLLVFSSTRQPMLLAVSAFFSTAGIALCWPSISGLLSDASVKRDRGRIVGVWNTSEGVGYLLGPLLGGVLIQHSNIKTPFIIIGF